MSDEPNMTFTCAHCHQPFEAGPDAFVECGITLMPGGDPTEGDEDEIVNVTADGLVSMSKADLAAIGLTPDARDQMLAFDPETAKEPLDIPTGAEPICPACQSTLFGASPATDPGEVSDGYHTFNELYEHRHALFLALAKAHPEISWISLKHHDGSEWDGWFIAGMDLPAGPITYHLPIRLWYMAMKTGAAVLERGKEWDGHTSGQVVIRLQCFVHAP